MLLTLVLLKNTVPFHLVSNCPIYLKNETLGTPLTLQLCKMSEIKYSLATFFVNGVCSILNDSAMHSTISPPASACSIHQTMVSAIGFRSGNRLRNISSNRSLWELESPLFFLGLGWSSFLEDLESRFWEPADESEVGTVRFVEDSEFPILPRRESSKISSGIPAV